MSTETLLEHAAGRLLNRWENTSEGSPHRIIDDDDARDLRAALARELHKGIEEDGLEDEAQVALEQVRFPLYMDITGDSNGVLHLVDVRIDYPTGGPLASRFSLSITTDSRGVPAIAIATPRKDGQVFAIQVTGEWLSDLDVIRPEEEG